MILLLLQYLSRACGSPSPPPVPVPVSSTQEQLHFTAVYLRYASLVKGRQRFALSHGFVTHVQQPARLQGRVFG